MTWDRAPYAPRPAAEDTASLAFFQSRRGKATGGSASTTSQTAKRDTLPPLILSEAMRVGLHAAQARQRFREMMLGARREILAADAKRLRGQMRCKLASICEAQLRDVTHEILSQGSRR